MRWRNRKGQGFIGLLLVVIIVGYLWKSGVVSSGLKPQTMENQPVALQGLPEAGAMNTFKMAAQQVKNAVADYQMKKSTLPRDLADLHAETGVDLMKDPWGGQYYVQQGWLRCTGNPQAAEKVW
ncbi:MAG: hypothetical protein HY816_07210 [Candidatus Wallbacteria bacterium]|nr:hypothetical protein [Candidatus Wallbacteria bacterium]